MQGCRCRWRPVVSPVIYTLCLSVYYNCTQNCTCTINCSKTVPLVATPRHSLHDSCKFFARRGADTRSATSQYRRNAPS